MGASDQQVVMQLQKTEMDNLTKNGEKGLNGRSVFSEGEKRVSIASEIDEKNVNGSPTYSSEEPRISTNCPIDVPSLSKGASLKQQNQQQNNMTSNGEVSQTTNESPAEIMPKGSKPMAPNGDDIDDKSKPPVVQQKGRFKVTSESIDFDKPSSIGLQKSHSIQVISQLQPQSFSPLADSSPSYANSFFQQLQLILQSNIVQRDHILSIMKQISTGDPSEWLNTLIQLSPLRNPKLLLCCNPTKKIPRFPPEMSTRLLLFILLALLPFSTPQQSCTLNTFSQNRIFNLCNSLPELSSTLHWTYHPSNSTVDIAYRAPQSADGWIAWALNPTGSGMIGAQAIFAFLDSIGSMTTISYPLANTSPTVRNISLSYKVYSMESEFLNGMMVIYATIELPGNNTRVNHVWQESNLFTNGFPNGHRTSGPNVLSTGVLDLLSGQFTATGNSRLHLKNRHGVLNAVSWGILMPIGAIIARYLRVFKSADPAWFYLHVACQISAYVVGVAGWGIGLKLGSDSKGITYHTHRNIGIALFCLATLQVFALLMRPNKNHKHRLYWNIYHHLTGYSVIILSVINIFKGFDILEPENKWKHAYIAIISTLGGISVILEAVTWAIVLNRKKSESSEKFQQGENGVNGKTGHDSRQHQVA